MKLICIINDHLKVVSIIKIKKEVVHSSFKDYLINT